MDNFLSVSEAARAIQEFLYDREAGLPDDVREQLKELAGPTNSPVTTVTKGAELIYARRSELSEPVLLLGAGLALICEQFNFSSMATDHRGSLMALAMMRDAKVSKPAIIGDYPTEDNDPVPLERFVAPLPEPMVEVPVDIIPPAEGARRGRGRPKGAINKS